MALENCPSSGWDRSPGLDGQRPAVSRESVDRRNWGSRSEVGHCMSRFRPGSRRHCPALEGSQRLLEGRKTAIEKVLARRGPDSGRSRQPTNKSTIALDTADADGR